MPLGARDCLLHAMVYDHDMMGDDDFLGEVLVELADLDEFGPHVLTVELDDLIEPAGRRKRGVTGTLTLELTYAPSR